ncbi:hypothetical protein BS78_05G118000 [Paspalum vaginatum]|nr:hypothetical protein BS78_05G118000 [Paspalum vaginatum]
MRFAIKMRIIYFKVSVWTLETCETAWLWVQGNRDRITISILCRFFVDLSRGYLDNVELAREDMDRQLQHERDEMDRIVKEAREEMDLKLKLQRSKFDINILEERMSMDHKVKGKREISDRRLKEERDHSDRMVKEERNGLDRKLRTEHQNMDRILEFEQVEMDGIKMMACANMDCKLLQELTDNQPVEPELMHNVQPDPAESDVSFDTIPRSKHQSIEDEGCSKRVKME